MSNVRDYLRKRAERKENKQTAKNVGNLIIKHRMAIISRTILVILLCAALGATIYVQLKNQVFTSYVTLSSVDKQQYDNAVCLNYEKGFLTYSKDGISYTDNKGNAIWNQTFEMQDPMVRIARTRVAVADYNGHIIHNIALSGDAVEIDTNLPIRQFALAENGMVAAILEDTNITWIYLYNSAGEKVAYIKTTMQKSGYPAAVALSPDGKLMAVSYITVESGAAKSSVAFYNFSSVGQNFVDNFASGADYVDAVIPYLTFINGDTAFAVADNRLVIYSGDQRPKSTADVSLVLSILKPVLEIAEALLGGALLGAINGALINFTKLHPFIITLGTQSIFRGVTMIISDAKPIFGFPQSFKTAFGGMIGGKIPMPVVWALLVAAILWFVTTKSKMGRNFYALGGNKEAAWFSGINVRLHTLLVHIISGICAGICGVVMIARLGSAEPMAGSGHETFAIAAAIIGGTSFFGGKGRIFSVVIGGLIIGTINNGLNILQVQTYYQLVVMGGLIIAAVALDRLISK